MIKILGKDCSQLIVWGCKVIKTFANNFFNDEPPKGNSDTLVSENSHNWKRQ